jgi:6,7-dimethyl-8-ribityllumazine synthase
LNHINAQQLAHIKSFPLAIVVSRFNQELTQELLQGALRRLQELEFTTDYITIVEVPGAIEIPIIAKRLAESKRFQSIIALGAVIRGETTHYDYVCELVSQGCQQISLDYNLPVIFGVLTTENDAQAWDRLGGKHGHKGVDAVDCALAMHSILDQLP